MRDQRLRDDLRPRLSAQAHPIVLHEQAVLHVQTGLQLQPQFWQAQATLAEAVSLVVMFFMDEFGFNLGDGAAGPTLQRLK